MAAARIAPALAGDALEAWVRSGVAALSGPQPGGRLGPPARLVPGVAALGARIEAASAEVGQRVQTDWLALLSERARLEGGATRGRTSCGGATRLLPCADGWIAVSLARPSDLAALPALLALSGGAPDGVVTPADQPPWEALGRAVAPLAGRAVVEAAALLGVPVAQLDERPADPTGGVHVQTMAVGAPRRQPSVVDLSSLWAGPLCGAVLAAAGAEVRKVESSARPDAARHGSPALFERLNGKKQHTTLDLATPSGRAELADLVASADVVLESSRPRALEQLGLDASTLLAQRTTPLVWISITGHGRASGRVAFGDDAAVAGGLVVRDDSGPWFCGDAIADPLSGLAAAATALELLASGATALLDVAMAGVAAAHAGPTLALPAGVAGSTTQELA